VEDQAVGVCFIAVRKADGLFIRLFIEAPALGDIPVRDRTPIFGSREPPEAGRNV